ncbi:MAG: glycosyltransferase [Sulfurimonas sp.]|jgi:glycosyltransferase involved in cell wall biosynthesis
MQVNNQISIVIPTYNRADFLDYSLQIHMPLAKKHNVAIFIFDNASTDGTQQVAKKWMQEYPYLSYVRHESNIGAVLNVEFALKYPKTEFVWLLGDTYQIPENGIDSVLECINETNQKLDVIVCNLENKLEIATKTYEDANSLLYDLGALMTCIAVLVLSKSVIEKGAFERFRATSFPHAGIIFEEIAKRDFLIYWMSKVSIKGLHRHNLKKTNWSHTPKAFEIGCEDWTNFVMSLPPSYRIDNKMKCIMDFGKVSGLFTLRTLLLLRALGILNIKSLKQFHYLLPLTIDFPRLFLYGLSLIPKRVVKFVIFLYILFFNKGMKQKYLLLFREA